MLVLKNSESIHIRNVFSLFRKKFIGGVNRPCRHGESGTRPSAFYVTFKAFRTPSLTIDTSVEFAQELASKSAIELRSISRLSHVERAVSHDLDDNESCIACTEHRGSDHRELAVVLSGSS